MRLKEAIQTRIRQICEQEQFSINSLATHCNISQSTLNNIISGRNNSATVSTIQKICDGVGMDLSEFFDSDLFREVEQEII